MNTATWINLDPSADRIRHLLVLGLSTRGKYKGLIRATAPGCDTARAVWDSFIGTCAPCRMGALMHGIFGRGPEYRDTFQLVDAYITDHRPVWDLTEPFCRFSTDPIHSDVPADVADRTLHGIIAKRVALLRKKA